MATLMARTGGRSGNVSLMGKKIQTDMQLRAGIPEDAEVCGRICYEAFKTFADHHNFPTEIPTPEFSVGIVSMMLSHPGFYSVVAEREGEVEVATHNGHREQCR